MKSKPLNIIFAVLMIGALIGGLLLVEKSQETRRGAYFAGTKMLIVPEAISGKVGSSVNAQLFVETEKVSPVVPLPTITATCKEQCPGADGVLRSCSPPEGDGTSADSICDRAGRFEPCGRKFWCCPAAGGKWTTDLTKCPGASGGYAKISSIDTQVCYGKDLILDEKNLKEQIELNKDALGTLVDASIVNGNCLRLVAIADLDKKPSDLKGGMVKIATIKFKAATAGTGDVKIDGTKSKVGGYNPAPGSTDSALKIGEIKNAKYIISGSGTIVPTKKPTVIPTIVPKCNAACTTNSQCPSGMMCYYDTILKDIEKQCAEDSTKCPPNMGVCRNVKCPTKATCVCATPTVVPTLPPVTNCDLLKKTQGKYFTQCTNGGFGGVCFDKYTSVYQGCTEKGKNTCTANNTNAKRNILCLLPTPTVTPRSCNQSCGVNNSCKPGLVCFPQWWPCPEKMPAEILEKAQTPGESLSEDEKQTLVRICPAVEGGIPDVMPPILYGVCRNPQCLWQTNCQCQGQVRSDLFIWEKLDGKESYNVGDVARIGLQYNVPPAGGVQEMGRVSGINAHVAFNKDLMQATEIVIDDPAFNLYTKKEIDNKNGLVWINISSSLPFEKLHSGIAAATIKFKMVKAGKGMINVSKSFPVEMVGYNNKRERIRFSTVVGEDKYVVIDSITSDLVLDYKMAFGNVNGNDAKCVVDWPIQIIVLGGGKTAVYPGVIPQKKEVVDGKLIFSGTLELTNWQIKNGVAVFAKGPKHIQVKYGQNNQEGPYNRAGGEISLFSADGPSVEYDFTKYPMIPGDVVGTDSEIPDGKINGADYSYIKSKALIHETADNSKGDYYLRGDLDGNCQVNSMDVLILKISLKERQGELY